MYNTQHTPTLLLVKLQREDSRIRVVKFFRAEATDVWYTIDVMAEGTEVRIRYEVEGEKASQEEGEQKGNANDEQDSLTECVPLAKGDVGHKDNG